MLAAIKNFFDSNLAIAATGSESKLPQVDKIQLACAALLIEVMNSDHAQDSREMATFVGVLESSLQLDAHKLSEVVDLAQSEARQATSLYEFTGLINVNYTYEEKLSLMENMWRVAYSDSQLDKYEDHLIRKVSELIYVRHSDFIRTKLKIRDSILE